MFQSLYSDAPDISLGSTFIARDKTFIRQGRISSEYNESSSTLTSFKTLILSKCHSFSQASCKEHLKESESEKKNLL